MKKSRKEFIIKAHSESCSEWKANIEKEFPKLFKKDELEVGWYATEKDHKWICYFDGKELLYGINWKGEWFEFGSEKHPSHQKPQGKDYLTTDKEVETALIKEAKKRGFKKGVRFLCEEYGKSTFDGHFRYNHITKDALDGFNVGNIFIGGKWATIIETITKADAEKALNKTIID